MQTKWAPLHLEDAAPELPTTGSRDAYQRSESPQHMVSHMLDAKKKKLQSCLFGLIGAETAPPGAGFSKVAKSAVFFQGRLGGLFFLWGPSRTTEDIWSLPAFVCERKRGHALQ